MLIPAIVKFMCDMDEDEEIVRTEKIIMFSHTHTRSLSQRKWCLHTLFFLLCNNDANQRHALEVPNFGVRYKNQSFLLKWNTFISGVHSTRIV